jgi:lipopolysaccharide transport system ATP-binding protein
MTSSPAISVRNLSKCYKLGTIGRHTLVDECQYLWHKLRGRDPRQHMTKIGHTANEVRKVEAEQEGSQEFWALKDVSFDVQPGEVVGIIGRNGAGKSTLLKLLTRITEPTSGEVVITGRVASLLEVGTGFHPELTGRENVYMNGTILGMKKREVDAKFDEIVAFSELEKFIDTPVKRYSSGMYVRLAFAVAAHLEPEILLVDEVLAVGDAQFQRKCIGKMEDVARRGQTVIFVSHQMSAIAQLCTSVVVMLEGRMLAMGQTDAMIDLYLTTGSSGGENEYHRSPVGDAQDGPCILAARTVDVQMLPRQEFDFRESVSLQLDLQLTNLPSGAVLGVSLKDRLDRRLFTSNRPCVAIGGGRDHCSVTIRLPSGLLTPGHYSFLFSIHVPNKQVLDYVHSACHFALVETGSEFAAYAGSDYGSFFVNCEWIDS